MTVSLLGDDSEDEELPSPEELRRLADELEDDEDDNDELKAKLEQLVSWCQVEESPTFTDGEYIVFPNDRGPDSRSLKGISRSDDFEIRYFSWGGKTEGEYPTHVVVGVTDDE